MLCLGYIQRYYSPPQLKEENYTHCSSSSPHRNTEERFLTLIVPNVCQYSDFLFPSLKKGKPHRLLQSLLQSARIRIHVLDPHILVAPDAHRAQI